MMRNIKWQSKLGGEFKIRKINKRLNYKIFEYSYYRSPIGVFRIMGMSISVGSLDGDTYETDRSFKF